MPKSKVAESRITAPETVKSSDPPELFMMERAVLAAAEVVVRAANGTLSATGREVTQWRKADKTIVSSLDLECEQVAMAAIPEGTLIVSEERPDTHHLITHAARYLTLDPIDGTSACLHFLAARGGQVGFGPLVGLVSDGHLVASTFYHVPLRTLFTTVRDHGTVRYCVIEQPSLATVLPALEDRSQVPQPAHPHTLQEAVLLFYAGKGGEGRIVDSLKGRGIVNNCYRFGGFANDCIRIALGLEVLQLQFAVKPWDFPATLFLQETGIHRSFDPLNRAIPSEMWKVELENPLIAAPPLLLPQLLDEVRKAALGQDHDAKIPRSNPQ